MEPAGKTKAEMSDASSMCELMAIDPMEPVNVAFSMDIGSEANSPIAQASAETLHEFVCDRLRTQYEEMANVTMSPAARRIPRVISVLDVQREGALLKCQSVWLPVNRAGAENNTEDLSSKPPAA